MQIVEGERSSNIAEIAGSTTNAQETGQESKGQSSTKMDGKAVERDMISDIAFVGSQFS
jgi:hypothetical protein